VLNYYDYMEFKKIDAASASLTGSKKFFDTESTRMSLGIAPDSDRFFAYDPNTGYLYRCKPWW
jgi:hypothetical protein